MSGEGGGRGGRERGERGREGGREGGGKEGGRKGRRDEHVYIDLVIHSTCKSSKHHVSFQYLPSLQSW